MEPFAPDPAFDELAVPRQAGVREEQRQAWLTELRALPEVERLCLVIRTDEAVLWLSPALGLLRSVEENSVQELITAVARK